MVQLGYEEFKNNFYRTQTELGPKFTRLLPQDAVLLGSDSSPICARTNEIAQHQCAGD